MSTPRDIEDLISKWPSIGDFASAIGCGYEAARQMRMRNSIAPKHWTNVVSACAENGVDGVSLEWLADNRAVSAKEPAE
ncbi:hypothetical protein CSC94_12620 [Zhengella mangrovi]|uniref:Transcriptional regulator n=1 Tax=Zhengella mangrovi TaxID=1982044 RepID=A0A2G1QM53_9HYPH|nr:hypothetical protein [Zhengella mangrovi]PHP66530.1 hypothetical protein CSC94_12620 [Zhengella mangrovi]